MIGLVVMSRRDLRALFTSTARDEYATALLGVAVGVLFGICSVTGVTSHLIQHPLSWFRWPSGRRGCAAGTRACMSCRGWR